jgi:hypothetical protein
METQQSESPKKQETYLTTGEYVEAITLVHKEKEVIKAAQEQVYSAKRLRKGLRL